MNVVPQIESHLNALIAAVVERDIPMWPSVIDVRTGRFPDGDHVPRRVYRLIGAPRGSTLYWDQPLVLTAYALTEVTGLPCYAQAADAYIQAFLERCVAPTGMFRWGNHMYFDVFTCQVVEFHKGHHELRPLTPIWELFWRHAPEATATYIAAMGRRHVYDPASGAFNRHDTGARGHAFLEAGGILCESLAWLHGKTGDGTFLDQALGIARYSYGHRGAATGLVRNEPDAGRWDSRVATTETGLWAQCLLRAGDYTGNAEFSALARSAVRAYITHAYDSASAQYFGQVFVDSGQPCMPSETGYWPQRHADPWNTDQWPTHDYPMALAEACLSLHALTGETVFRDAVRRWTRIAIEGRPSRTGKWTYAENYGRCIHFLTRTARQLHDDTCLAAAMEVAEDAVTRLYENGMFQGYAGGHVHEAVDGSGVLCLALLALETGREIDPHR